MSKELIYQINKTIKAAKEVQKCQIKFCKTQRDQSAKRAKIMQKELMELMKNTPSNKLVNGMKKIKSHFYESNETKDLGICTLEKCEKELKNSFRELLNMYKIGKTPDNQLKYKQGKEILSNDLDIKAYVNFLKITL